LSAKISIQISAVTDMRGGTCEYSAWVVEYFAGIPEKVTL
jgi:hypothetical protein